MSNIELSTDTSDASDSSLNVGAWFRNPIGDLGKTRFLMLCVGVLAQLITVWMTWPVWQVREAGVFPNLPVFDVPSINFGWAMFLSTLLVLAFPKPVIWINLVILLVATSFDQMRAQPQYLANWLLMFAAIVPAGPQIIRLFLATLWFWAGLHKFLSPDWHTYASWDLVSQCGFDPAMYQQYFIYAVAFSEMGLGIIAFFKPRWTVIACPLLHFGIVIFLSPLFRNWNFSVIPWNLATAIVGAWIFWEVAKETQTRKIAKAAAVKAWEYGLLAVFLIVPAGFFVGMFDHGYAHVLYSAHIPRGIVTQLNGDHYEINGWGELRVPFPNERRTLKQYFGAAAEFGEKLHIHDPRELLDDLYFVMTIDGPVEVEPEVFYQSTNGGPIGVGIDTKRNVFLLTKANVRMLVRDTKSSIYAVAVPPTSYSPEVISLIAGLPNVEQIQLSKTAVTNEDLKQLLQLHRLEGIGLMETAVSEEGFELLRKIPSLKTIQSDSNAMAVESD
jgi:hypothetical protein